MDLVLETFDVPAMVRGRGDHDPAAGARRTPTGWRSSCPDDLGSMHADLTKVRQSLFNLLSNACKFTEDGHGHAGGGRATGAGRRLDSPSG